MNIVIVGAGDIGMHIAALVSQKGNSVFLIDHDKNKLHKASQNLDLAIKVGSGTNWKILEDLVQHAPDLLLAFTNNDEVNLVACTIAKQLGFPRTLARVHSSNYINSMRLDFSRLFYADHLICPELLVARDFYKSLLYPGAIFVQNFAHGAVQMITLPIPSHWKKGHIPLEKLELPHGIVVGLIRRNSEKGAGLDNQENVIFPHGKDHLIPGDEVTFIGETTVMLTLHYFLGIQQEKARSVILIGGTLINCHLAELLLQLGVHVRIIDKDAARCRELSETLLKAVIIHQNGLNIDFYNSERVDCADAFIATTKRDEVNLLAANLAIASGCKQVMVSLADTRQMNIAKNMGVSHVFSPRMSCENQILAMISSDNVNSAVSFYNDQAEVMEIKISQDCKITGIPIAEMGPYLPKDFLFAVIQNRGRILIANGQCVLSPGDTVIAITHPRYASELQELF
ncbi:MAG: Trk system potassium transporter TrkA [Parachlamydiales bacterium]|nr:Trk system potassium transporter TrkA [Parachlamydiales bacterium]